MYHSLQGNVGLGQAIAYFTSNQIPISIPLNDTQKYDLVVDIDNQLYKVSVKTSRYSKNENSYIVMLKNCGGSSGKSKTRLFDNSIVDYIFIYTGNGDMYLIPSKEISAVNSICVGNKYTEYLVYLKDLNQFK